MDRKYTRERVIDRTDWKSGPWDNEPDYLEWTTDVGYPAYMFRLDSGSWVCVVEAPSPSDGKMILAFSHTLRDKRWNKEYGQPGSSSYTDVEGIVGYNCSMEHWECPGHSEYHKTFRGPYKTLEETKQICEDVAKDIFDIHKEGTYVNYFNW